MSKEKRLISELNKLTEMSRLGNEGNYVFWVYKEPLNPSIHVQFSKEFEVVLQIKDLKILEVKFNKGPLKLVKGQLPPSNMLKAIQHFLSLPHYKQPKLTNREMFDALWDANNPKVQV